MSFLTLRDHPTLPYIFIFRLKPCRASAPLFGNMQLCNQTTQTAINSGLRLEPRSRTYNKCSIFDEVLRSAPCGRAKMSTASLASLASMSELSDMLHGATLERQAALEDASMAALRPCPLQPVAQRLLDSAMSGRISLMKEALESGAEVDVCDTRVSAEALRNARLLRACPGRCTLREAPWPRPLC